MSDSTDASAIRTDVCVRRRQGASQEGRRRAVHNTWHWLVMQIWPTIMMLMLWMFMARVVMAMMTVMMMKLMVMMMVVMMVMMVMADFYVGRSSLDAAMRVDGVECHGDDGDDFNDV